MPSLPGDGCRAASDSAWGKSRKLFRSPSGLGVSRNILESPFLPFSEWPPS